mmetsp:Transcript_109406/g.172474  ORF Transcript_109406/g.172474 Transcript_109406/m.172474 type:complete len:450 (-) Transcript_109406:162-1511(-)
MASKAALIELPLQIHGTNDVEEVVEQRDQELPPYFRGRHVLGLKSARRRQCLMLFVISAALAIGCFVWFEATKASDPDPSLFHRGRAGMNTIAHQQFTGQIPSSSVAKYAPIKAECTQKVKTCSDSVSQTPEKVDLVIPWVYYKGDEALKMELRSFEKYGLLDFVNNVYVLVDSKDVKTINITEKFPYSKHANQAFHVLMAKDIIGADSWCYWPDSKADFHEVHTGYCKLSKLHLIPDISPWVIVMPDDDVLVNQFSLDAMYDSAKKLPYGYSHGSLGDGMCLGDQPTSALHGPTLLNTCVMKQIMDELEQKYYNLQDNGTLTCSGQPCNVMTSDTMMDNLCIAVHALQHAKMLAGFFRYNGGPSTQRKPLFIECHTNGGCENPNTLPDDGMFANIQGNGVSAEYPPDETLHKKFFDWFGETYPAPSRFENKVLALVEQGRVSNEEAHE